MAERAQPGERTPSAERAEYLDDLLAALSPRQRQVLVLRLGARLSAEDTARIVGETARGVRLTQHRALNCLRQRLENGLRPRAVRTSS